jgi:aerobic-type carbon monoxide dehydrogenase small subunit (CoxS/CutS family)
MSEEREKPEDGTEEEPGGVSRRDFLKGVGVGGGVLGVGILASAVPAAKPGEPRRFGPGAVPLTLTVNGQARSVTVEPRATLLDALRDRLDLTGAKRVCDRGECGGCTILLDGRPVYACMMLAIDARGRKITTIEGLGAPGRLHPLQESFIEKDAMQCGFCTPGMVVAAKGLLDAVPRPSLDQVKEGLAGHLCRCGTYPRIFEAVQAASRRTERKS